MTKTSWFVQQSPTRVRSKTNPQFSAASALTRCSAQWFVLCDWVSSLHESLLLSSSSLVLRRQTIKLAKQNEENCPQKMDPVALAVAMG